MPKIDVVSFQDKQLRTNCFKFNLINSTTIWHYNAQQFDGTGDTWKQETSKPLMRNLLLLKIANYGGKTKQEPLTSYLTFHLRSPPYIPYFSSDQTMGSRRQCFYRVAEFHLMNCILIKLIVQTFVINSEFFRLEPCVFVAATSESQPSFFSKLRY